VKVRLASPALNSAVEQDSHRSVGHGHATYFSPEQAQGAQPDPRSDLYSLGIVLYEMVAGKPPFTGDNPVGIAYKQVHDAPQPLNQLVADVPRPFEAIVAKLLAKNAGPQTRRGSGDDLRFREGPTRAAALMGEALPPHGRTASLLRSRAMVNPSTAATATAVLVHHGDAAPPCTAVVGPPDSRTDPRDAPAGTCSDRSSPSLPSAGGFLLFNYLTDDRVGRSPCRTSWFTLEAAIAELAVGT
jgi:serine/threonine-protein kinase